jgi:hypothetical protein
MLAVRGSEHNLYRGRVMAGLVSPIWGWFLAPPGILVGSIGCSMGPSSP